MHRAALLAALLLGAGLARCIGAEDSDNLDASGLPDGATATDVSFQSPLKASHPAYDLPTINDPTRNVEGEVPAWWHPPAQAEVPGDITGLSHLGQIEDEEERGAGIAIFGRLAIVPGYVDTTTVYDISDPANPTIQDQWNPNTNVWDVWYYQGYLFTGDLARGMDTLEPTGE